MEIIVQKFGGTSVRDERLRERVLQHIAEARRTYDGVVVVVSAMGRKGEPYATDSLLDLLEGRGKYLPARERDLLLTTGEIISAVVLADLLWRQDIPATVFTGAQAGIVTDARFGEAQILDVRPDRLRAALERGRVAVVAGFQGSTEDGELTTLGRGGSDITAVALAAALGARRLDIFTDVNGVFTADPRIVEEARPLKYLTYAEVANLAHLGARVLHPRAVEIAMQYNIPVRVRSTTSDDEGTLIASLSELRARAPFRERVVTGIAHVFGVTQIKVVRETVDPELQLVVFRAMAEHGISVDFINVSPNSVAYTVRDEEGERVAEILRGLGFEPIVTPGCAKVSVVGAGMAGRPGVMSRIVEALVGHDIPILQAADSHTTIWVLVPGERAQDAIRLLHRHFELERE
ncbi:aspartate kinase [Brockia lithotrophica]|uniref:Aspartokinase n=1 Tax=Brockia lithotrophica TaxID=933949 RepID=A0A660L111_9BACL|nr:aspartate kinase [Brockia lithotrophica]RKQ84249.1 aspartate kinase [Brockia lithotrophica]